MDDKLGQDVGERTMGDQIAKAQDLVAKAEKKLKGWNMFGNKYEEALEMLEKAVNGFKLAKACARSCDIMLPST